MKTILTLTLTAALTAGTFQANAQEDALAQMRARRAAEQQQLGGGQTAEAAPFATQPTDAAAYPTTAPADSANDPAAALRARRAAENSGGQPAGNPAFTTAPAATTTVATPVETPQVFDYTPSTTASLSTNGIVFNFRNAALSDVLTYMSDAAGYTILLNAPVNSRVTVISTHPMTKEKAVDVLNSVLNQSGLAAIVGDNDTLTIMSKNEAIHADIPINQGNKYTDLSKSAEIITQIIPIRFVDAQQLVVDISPFISSQAIIVANQAGNSVIITDTKANIRHLMQIIASIDSSAEMQTAVKVFALKHANPNDVVAMLSGVFPSTTGGAQTISFGGFGGGRGGGGGGGRGGGGNTSAQRVQKAQQVSAVADGRTQSVVVTCANEMMDQIGKMIAEVDIASDRDPEVQVVTLKNADPYAAAAALQAMFSGTTTQQRNQNTTSPLTTRSTTQFSTTGSGTTTTGGGGGATTGGGRGGAGQ